jgi:23S rRNA pseudouridine1911/1915/1917 synthase
MSDIEQKYQIPLEQGGQRVDKVAASLFAEFSRAELTRWIVEGALTLDGNTVKAKHKVLGGEWLDLRAQRQSREAWDEAEQIPLNVVYEDDDLILINKPAGLVVHPGAGNRSGTLVNGLLNHRADLQRLPRAGIVHRLDKDTSGIMVVAASSLALRGLVDGIQQRLVQRSYVGICEGVMIAGQDVDQPIGRDPKHRTRQAIRDDGKPALSHIRVRERYRAHSMVDVRLATGRTHQIRVHMQSIGFPLVGDSQYGWRRIVPPRAESHTIAALHEFPRQALHAAKLQFDHPVSGETMSFSAPLPTDFVQLAEALAADAD